MKKEIMDKIKTSYYSYAKGLLPIGDFYVYKSDDNYFGVALDNIYDVTINESFSNVRIKTEKLIREDREYKLITLMTNMTSHRDIFAAFSMHFIENDDPLTRQMILNNPIGWWVKWKELIGNKLHNPKAYDIISELLVLYLLLKKGKKVDWFGPSGSTIDISTNNEFYEVKSSLVRYENEITISSQFQLTENFDNFFLIFIKLEQMIGGISIDSILLKIKSLLGENNSNYLNIEKKLEDKGFKNNMSIRKQEYVVHEIRKYEVNEKFPKINLNSFKNNKLPNNIKKIQYTVNLDGLEFNNWDIGDIYENS